MTIDISQFNEAYLEEAKEHLLDLENGLLQLEENPEGADISAIFRAAHSIKGGAATFGFDDIANFTHVVESVLQKARDGDIQPDSTLTTHLLRSVDIINDMVQAAQGGTSADSPDKQTCMDALEKYASGELTPSNKLSEPSTTGKADTQTYDDNEKRLLQITFKPFPNMADTGSDPINIIRELASLGDITVKGHAEGVPDLDEINPSELYLWWDIELMTDAPPDEVREAFLFVEDEAEIHIDLVAGVNKEPQQNEAEENNSARPETGTMEVISKGERREGTDRRKADRRQTEPPKETAYIRVAIDKVDSLINMVGELVTTNAMVELYGAHKENEEVDNQNLTNAITEMVGHTRNLQEAIMGIRMLPIDFAFSRFPPHGS
jgi:two-component system chemotaxis sensor kinase CheA